MSYLCGRGIRQEVVGERKSGGNLGIVLGVVMKTVADIGPFPLEAGHEGVEYTAMIFSLH